MRIAKTVSSGDWSFRNNLENFDDNPPFLLKTLKTAAFCRKVTQISNFIIFQRKK